MISKPRTEKLKNLETKLGIIFEHPDLLNQSLTHSSYSFEKNNTTPDNERLEFFGDAVLKLAISEHLYKRFPKSDEGELTKIRAVIVSDMMLAKKAAELKLGEYMLLGSNEQRTGGTNRESNLANVLEAIFGAYYLDQRDIRVVNSFIVTIMTDLIEEAITPTQIIDAKSALQEFTQSQAVALPNYELIKEEGPDHDKSFFIEVSLTVRNINYRESGQGKTKKEAEQDAARKALSKICI